MKTAPEKTKTVTSSQKSPSRARVKEIAVARLEALTQKQRLRHPRRRALPKVSALGQARKAEGALALARWEQRRKRETLAKQIEALTQHLCGRAFLTKRGSLRAGYESAFVSRIGSTAEGCPRLKETGPAIRALDRAEALLTRLVWRGAVAQARLEMEADNGKADVQKEADVQAF